MDCRRCGRCCAPYFAVYVSDEDEKRWYEEKRTDILARLEYERENIIWMGDQPVNIDTGNIAKCCFYLEYINGIAYCSIHNTKPKICKSYQPASSQLCAFFQPERDYIIGIDLHGTLLEPGEVFPDELAEPIALELRLLSKKVVLYLCTGNDLEFVNRKIPEQVLEPMDGYVLETGCAISKDKKTEEVLTTEEERENIFRLKELLEKAQFSEVNYFAHRLTTISMFCDHPKEFYKKVLKFVEESEFASSVNVTYSSVAVDILPAGYNKFYGLKRVSAGKKTIGLADSINDMALLTEADFAFSPANIARELELELQARGRRVMSLYLLSQLDSSVLGVASKNETYGVLEILKFLNSCIKNPQG